MNSNVFRRPGPDICLFSSARLHLLKYPSMNCYPHLSMQSIFSSKLSAWNAHVFLFFFNDASLFRDIFLLANHFLTAANVNIYLHIIWIWPNVLNDLGTVVARRPVKNTYSYRGRWFLFAWFQPNLVVCCAHWQLFLWFDKQEPMRFVGGVKNRDVTLLCPLFLSSMDEIDAAIQVVGWLSETTVDCLATPPWQPDSL